jgi:urea carboxylase-associated protein 2
MSALVCDRLLWEEHLHSGAHWSGVARRGTKLRLTDVEGGANVAALFYNYEERLERYNMADTLKAQHTAFLTQGHVCYSDMGRVLCSITADTCGWHDTFCGVSNAAMVAARFGTTRFQERRNDYYKNGYDSLLNELGKYGLGKRDLVSNVNFFSKVTADNGGELRFQADHSKGGSYVDLRFEMTTSWCLHLPAPARPSLVTGRVRCASARSPPRRRRRTTSAARTALRTRAAFATPRCSMREAADMEEPFSSTLIESRRDPTDASLNDTIPAGEPWMGVVCRGQTFRIVDIDGQPGRRYAVLQRFEQRRTLQRGRHGALPGSPLSHHRYATAFERRQRDAHDYRRHVRPP